jgi:hypothetical protein
MPHLLPTTLILLAAATAAQAQPSAQTVDTILAANHTAVGNVPTSGGIALDYDWSGSGLTGTHTDIADLATGAYLSTEQAGAIGDATGYDGAVPWQRDLSGTNTAQQGGDRIPVAVNAAYRLANGWWLAGHGGAAVAYVGRDTVDGRALDHLTVTPRGGKLFDAWFDAGTHLLAKIAEDRQFFHTKTVYDDYRPEGGLMLPHTITVDNGTGEAGSDHLKLTHAAIGPARPISAYARPTAPPTGGSIAGGAASVTVPFRLLNNHIYAQATVNGKGPYNFILDTGGHTLLSARIVSEAGLKSVGAAVETGAGEKTATSGFSHVDEVALGAVRLTDQIGITAEIYDKSIEGIPVDGMVGFELIRRFVTTIDYGRQTLTFTDPARFAPKDIGTPVPFVFYDHLPYVAGLIDDLPARFDIDTGSRSELDITGPFVAAHDLHARFAKGVSAVTGWGVGGPSRSYTVRLPSLTLGSVKIEGPTAGLSEDKGGSMSDPNYDGNVGGGLLKRFVVTFDYANQVMYLKPIVPPPADAGRFDRSGMWINASQAGYDVTDVSPGGPAAEAGIVVGDVITAIDGKPVVTEGLSDARISLRARPAGTKVEIAVTRGTEKTVVTLVLRDQI